MGRRRSITAGAGISLGAALGIAGPAAGADFTVTSIADDGGGAEMTLREAIQAAEANDNAAVDRILFRSGLSGTITLNGSQLPTIAEPLHVVGPGASGLTVSGNGQSRVFYAYPDPGDDVTVSGLTITGGEAGGAPGGGIRSLRADLVVLNSTIVGNDAFNGGGVAAFLGTATIRNSTISGNTANVTAGGVSSSYGRLRILSSTISGNGAAADGGGVYSSDSSLAPTLTDTVVANNTAPTGPDLGTDAGVHEDQFGASFSLIESTSSVTVNSTVAGSNLFAIDPKLGPLAANGGPTATHALLAGSPAINKGSSGAPGSDQRGAPRSGRPDIGAYERARCGGALINLVGTSGADLLRGTPGRDGILGLGGGDRLLGLGGADGLCGGGGRDRLIGGKGRDRLLGGAGVDLLLGGKGRDVLLGGKGRDRLRGGPGRDLLRGGPGRDRQRQ